MPAFESRPKLIQSVECVSIPKNENLYLLPGHIGLAEYEITLGIAQELSGSVVTLRNLPGALHYLIRVTAERYEIDLVLIDMSPSLGAVNQNLFSVSDYFHRSNTPGLLLKYGYQVSCECCSKMEKLV